MRQDAHTAHTTILIQGSALDIMKIEDGNEGGGCNFCVGVIFLSFVWYNFILVLPSTTESLFQLPGTIES